MKRVGRVYIVTDNILNRSYIGSTYNKVDIRVNQHFKSAYNPNSPSYYDLFHKMIRLIGKENFEYEILEDNIKEEELEEKEKYYIQLYNTYDYGYNGKIQGNFTAKSKSSIKSRQEADLVIKLLKNTSLSVSEISKKTGINKDRVSDINCGETFYDPNIDYPIRENIKYRRKSFSEEEINEIIRLLSETNKTYEEISNLYDCHYVTIRKINMGTSYRQIDIDYPIRKPAYKKKDDKTIKEIVNLLLKTSMSQQEIAEKVGVKRKVVNTINTGTYHRKKVEKLGIETFPIRKN